MDVGTRNTTELQTTVDESSDFSFPVDAVIHVIYLVFGILGLAGNGLVLVVMVRVRSLRTITNLFITNQSIIDFLSSFFLILFFYNLKRPDYTELGHTPWSVFLCRFWHSQYIFWSMLGCSTANLIVLTLERYIAVVLPIVYRNRVTWKTALAVAVVPWILGFAFQSYWAASHRLEDSKCYPSIGSRTLQALLGVFVFGFKLLAPVVAMFLVYYKILQKVKPRLPPSSFSVDINMTLYRVPRTENREAYEHDGTASQGIPGIEAAEKTTAALQPSSENVRHRMRMNILKTLLIVTIVFVLCWLPNQVLFLLYNLGFLDTTDIPYIRGTQYKISVVIVFINIWINPVIYTFKYRRFQEGLRKTFGFPSRVPNRVGTTRTETAQTT